MDSKQCFKCESTLPLDMFYRHPEMAGGRLNKCKECAKKDVHENRNKNIDYYRDYDRKRGSRQDISYLRRYRELNPVKYKAHCLLNNAIKKGFVKKELCCICGDIKSQAHHCDYSKPLDVIWFCCVHHREWHKHNNAING